ncbi:hypothetical protein [Uliginosibacterium sp. H1]|uniref:hypothetical protein n=1 Tax=Uliginosibacterium sp. H1 TaxID=3114757 RepID=UPI002E17D228|nr:hypothetical protein [Uliginosibacterium sp. H1]
MSMMEVLAGACFDAVLGGAKWSSDKLSDRIGLKQSAGTRFVLQWLIGFLLFLVIAVAGLAAALGLWKAGSVIASWFG